MIFDYFDLAADAVEFLIALGSIMGFLMLIVGILGWALLGQFNRYKMIKVVIVSIVLLTMCGGITTGFKYFHIY